MEIKGGNYVSQIKRLSDRILEQILAEKNIDAFNGAQGRILYVLWNRDGISLRELADKTGLAPTTLQVWLTVWRRQVLYAVCPIKTTAAKPCWHLPPRLKIWSRIIKRYPIKCPKFFTKAFLMKKSAIARQCLPEF